MHVTVFDFSQLLTQTAQRYLEFVRVSSFSVGIYVLNAGEPDLQEPHSEDEVYYVVSGRAKMKTGSDEDLKSFDVGPGTVIFGLLAWTTGFTRSASGLQFSCSLRPRNRAMKRQRRRPDRDDRCHLVTWSKVPAPF